LSLRGSSDLEDPLIRPIRDGHEGQCTVVTEARCMLAGKRMVRGRESECAKHYAEVDLG
jgi:hypothetical protein